MYKSFKIITLGCKVNQYESAYLEEALIREGYVRVGADEKADMAVINTCIVTQRAAYQSRQAVRKAIRENPSGEIAAIGCYAQVFPEELREIEGLTLAVGNTLKGQLPRLLKKRLDAGEVHCWREKFPKRMPFESMPIKAFSDRTRAFLKIQDGCRSFCSYCIVPYARGPLRSLDPDGVLSMLRSLSEEGYREVVLTGIHLGNYGIDLTPQVPLKGLLRDIGAANLPLRVRLSSLYPDEIDTRLIDLVFEEAWLCPHFHISLQSGDDGILKAMNRKYVAGDFARIIEYLHRKLPQAAVGVDLIAGFPGETHEAFQNTFRLIEQLPVSYLHVFPFSPRKGTPAAGFPDQVDHQVAKERAQALRKLGQKKKEDFYRSCLGKTFSVLTEGWVSEEMGLVKGWSDNYLPVVFHSQHLSKNERLLVRAEKLDQNRVFGSTGIHSTGLRHSAISTDDHKTGQRARTKLT